MSQAMSCRNGHTWRPKRDEWDSITPDSLSCPRCGERGHIDELLPRTIVTDIASDGGGHATEPRKTMAAQGNWDDTASALTVEPPKPVQVSGYQILGELGRGGMGVVYKARQTALNRVVALKMILDSAHAGPSALERFRNEGRAVAALAHPNVVQIYEVGESDGRPYFALEFVPGGSLADWLRSSEPPTQRQGAAVLELIARAMHAAHAVGIVHRDLKPGNVLMNRKHKAEPSTAAGARAVAADLAELPVPKVADFGLAKQLGGDSSQTRSGDVIGTPSYMAPEQAAARHDLIGPGTDVYALGTILYEMLTGAPPFRGETQIDTMLMVLEEDPVPPSQLRPKIARDLETICLKCLEKDPRRRYVTAEHMADDLRAFLEGRDIQARPAPLSRKAWQWVARNPTLAVGSAIAAVAAAAVLAVSLWYNLRLNERNAALLTAYTDLENADKQQRELNAELKSKNADLKSAWDQIASANERLKVEKSRAQAGYERARQAVRQMQEAVGQKWLKDVPQMDDVRRELLTDALRFHEQFLAEKATDPDVRFEAAKASREAGQLLEQLDKPAESEVSFRRGIELAGKLADEFAGRPEYARELAALKIGLGELLRSTGRDGTPEFAAAEELLTKALHMNPADGDARHELARARTWLAESQLRSRQLPVAEATYRRALADHRRLIQDHPGEAVYRFEAAGTLNDLARFLYVAKRPEEAIAAYRDALDECEKLVAGRPQDRDYRERRAVTASNLGLALIDAAAASEGPRKADLFSGADQALQMALKDLETLTREFPATPTYAHQMAQAWTAIGNLALVQERNDEARNAYEEALKLQQDLVGRAGRNTAWRAGLAVVLDNLARLSLREPAKALRYLDEAKVMHQTSGAAGDPERRGVLRNHFRTRTEVALAQKDAAAARDAIAAALEHSPKRGPDYFRAALDTARTNSFTPDKSAVTGRVVQFLRSALKEGYTDGSQLRGDLEKLRNASEFVPFRGDVAFVNVVKDWLKAAGP